jgi:tetratricopeptide (TPR) repeat protein
MKIMDAKQLADEGQAAYNKGEYLSAAQLFKAAADGYLLAGYKLESAEMANNCSVAYLKGGDAESALKAAINTDQVFVAKRDKLRQALALGNQAAAWEGVKQLDKAVAAYTQSAELLEEVGESELRAYVMQSLSAIQLRKGQYLEAYTTMGQGVMGIKKPNLTQKVLKSLMKLPFKFIR